MILLSSLLPSQIFNNNYFGKLRVIVKDGKVWFCLTDACKALEIRNPRDVKKRLDSRGVDTIDVSINSKNRHGEFTMMNPMTFIDEANLLPLYLPEQVGLRIPRKVKARLDSRGLISNEVSTNSKNRHGEFTRITTMTYIEESNLLPLHLPELLWFKNPRDVKKRLDSAGVISMDVSTSM